jgi:hypothetical protein
VIFLPGTQRCAKSGGVQILQTGTHTVHDFGHKEGTSQHSNKSCGCIIALRTICFPKYHKVYEPDSCIAGRVCAVRITRPDIDACVFVWYFPPDMHGPQAKETISLVVEWICKIVRKLPRRCMVFFGCDANARTGLDELGGTHDPMIGPCDPVSENHNGVMFRELLSDCELVAVSTHYQNSPTFYGSQASSQIYYIGCSLACWGTNSINKCLVLERSGDILQKIKTFGRKDHRPLAMYCDWALAYQQPPPMNLSLSVDLLMMAIEDKFRNA